MSGRNSIPGCRTWNSEALPTNDLEKRVPTLPKVQYITCQFSAACTGLLGALVQLQSVFCSPFQAPYVSTFGPIPKAKVSRGS